MKKAQSENRCDDRLTNKRKREDMRQDLFNNQTHGLNDQSNSQNAHKIQGNPTEISCVGSDNTFEQTQNLYNSPPVVGMKIDILDPDGIWSSASIVSVVSKIESQPETKKSNEVPTTLVVVRYDGWSSSWDETLNYPNARIKRHHTYSREVKAFLDLGISRIKSSFSQPSLDGSSLRGTGSSTAHHGLERTQSWTYWPCKVQIRMPSPQDSSAAHLLALEPKVYVVPYVPPLSTTESVPPLIDKPKKKSGQKIGIRKRETNCGAVSELKNNNADVIPFEISRCFPECLKKFPKDGVHGSWISVKKLRAFRSNLYQHLEDHPSKSDFGHSFLLPGLLEAYKQAVSDITVCGELPRNLFVRGSLVKEQYRVTSPPEFESITVPQDDGLNYHALHYNGAFILPNPSNPEQRGIVYTNFDDEEENQPKDTKTQNENTDSLLALPKCTSSFQIFKPMVPPPKSIKNLLYPYTRELTQMNLKSHKNNGGKKLNSSKHMTKRIYSDLHSNKNLEFVGELKTPKFSSSINLGGGNELILGAFDSQCEAGLAAKFSAEITPSSQINFCTRTSTKVTISRDLRSDEKPNSDSFKQIFHREGNHKKLESATPDVSEASLDGDISHVQKQDSRLSFASEDVDKTLCPRMPRAGRKRKLSNNLSTSCLKHSQQECYEVKIPITKEGLLLQLVDRNSKTAFYHYRRFSNGTQGTPEIFQLVRQTGDYVISVDGTDTEDKKFSQVVQLLKDIATKNKSGFVTLRFRDCMWKKKAKAIDSGILHPIRENASEKSARKPLCVNPRESKIVLNSSVFSHHWSNEHDSECAEKLAGSERNNNIVQTPGLATAHVLTEPFVTCNNRENNNQSVSLNKQSDAQETLLACIVSSTETDGEIDTSNSSFSLHEWTLQHIRYKACLRSSHTMDSNQV